jgi:hypothetical protein
MPRSDGCRVTNAHRQECLCHWSQKSRQDAGSAGEKTTAIQRRQRFLRGQNAVDLVTCGAGRNACATEKQKSKTPAGGQRYEKRKTKAMVRRDGLLFSSRL